MKIKKITSLVLTWSFLMLLLSSLVLYVMPQGKIAFWANWSWGGLDKHAWGAIHTNLGYLFLIACGFHIVFNWNHIVAYIKNKGRQVTVFNPNNIVSLLLVLLVAVFTVLELPPIHWIQSLNDYFKEQAIEKYGEPPYGHAEMSTIAEFCRRSQLDLSVALSELSESGMQVGTDETLLDVADREGITPQALAMIMSKGTLKFEKSEKGGCSFSSSSSSNSKKTNDASSTSAAGGTGKGYGMKTLQQVCDELGYDYETISKQLTQAGFNPMPDKKLKDIAAENGERASAIMAILLPGGH